MILHASQAVQKLNPNRIAEQEGLMFVQKVALVLKAI